MCKIAPIGSPDNLARHFQKTAKRSQKVNPREDRNTDKYFNNDNVRDIRSAPSLNPKKAVQLLPRNTNQEDYVDHLFDPECHVVFAMGPAGCGKTLLATQYAIHGLQTGEFEKIIITRPAVSVDENYGFLPGTLIEKLSPWMIPITDMFKEHYDVQTVEKMILNEQIEIAPLAYMRGRTLKHSLIIFDEAQNATVNQMKMVLTRIGEGSRMVVTGDLAQHDRGYEENGLKDFIARLTSKGSDMIALCKFDTGDVERHAVVQDILRIYGDE